MKTRSATKEETKALKKNSKLGGDNEVVVLKQETDIKFAYKRRIKITGPEKDVIESVTSSPPCYQQMHLKRKKKSPPCYQQMHLKRKKKSSGEELLCKSKERLDSGVFDDYMEKIWKNFSDEKKRDFAYFDSLWFSLYRAPSSKDKVLTWIDRENIFSKAYVFVPIVCWSHWSLLILCHFGESLQSTTRSRCMLLLDSLEIANPRRLEPEIRRFVVDIYKAGDRPETKRVISQIPLLVPKVPQQRDGNECGNFVLYFINLFFNLVPDDFSMEGYPYFMKKDWFTYENLDRFCETLNP